MSLVLREITKDNWQECIRLRVPPSQRGHVLTNVYALAESKFHPERVPLGVYDGQTMVGMVVCSFTPELERAWIHRLMIGEQHLSKGYTRLTMQKILNRLRKLPGCGLIGVDWRPGNVTLAKFYESFGFRRTGQTTRTGDVVAVLRLEPAAGAMTPSAASMDIQGPGTVSGEAGTDGAGDGVAPSDDLAEPVELADLGLGTPAPLSPSPRYAGERAG